MAFCTNCGAEIAEDNDFCTNCGSPRKMIVRSKTGSKNTKPLKIILIVTLVLVIVLGGTVSAKYINLERSKSKLTLGNKYLDQGKYEPAILSFQKTIQIDKKNIDARIGLAKAYLNTKDYTKASTTLKEALSIEPGHKKATAELENVYFLQGKDLFDQKKFKEASDLFKQAVAVNTLDSSMYLSIGNLYAASEEFQYEAFQYFTDGYNATKGEKFTQAKAELLKKMKGNTSGNALNGGLVARQGDWIYYASPADGGSIYSIKADGSEKKKVNGENSSSLNVIGDYIYYVSAGDIYRVNTDGSNRVKIKDSEDYRKALTDLLSKKDTITSNFMWYINGLASAPFSVESLYIANNKLIYRVKYEMPVQVSDFGLLVSANLDGKEDKIISSDLDNVKGPRNYTTTNPHDFLVDGDWIYYTSLFESSLPLYRVKADGSENMFLKDGSFVKIGADKDFLYYLQLDDFNTFEPGLFKINKSSQEVKKLADVKTSNYITAMNIDDNYLYYAANKDLFRVGKDGSNVTKLCSTTFNITSINITEDWIYLSNYLPDLKTSTVRVKPDGTGLSTVD